MKVLLYSKFMVKDSVFSIGKKLAHCIYLNAKETVQLPYNEVWSFADINEVIR